MTVARYLIVDSSVFLSRLMMSDVNRSISGSFFEYLKKKNITICIPIVTFFEILHAYFRVVKSIEYVDRFYQEMIDWNLSGKLKIINIESAFLAYFAAFHHLFDIKTADCIMAIAAHRFDYPLITWDRKLLLAAQKSVKAFTPKEFLKI